MASKEPGQEIWNDFWAEKNDMDKVYPSSPSVINTISKRFDLKNLKILEVGAGTGRDSCELARRGAEVFVLDYAPNSLAIISDLKEKYSLDNLTLVRGDAFSSPFADNTFDLVFHQGLLEHFYNPLDLLKENYRILKPGGSCLCDIPQTFHLYTIAKKILIAMDKWFAGWETQYTMSQLKKMMKDSSYEIDYAYGDWMRPNFLYRVLREVFMKLGIELPKYPLKDTSYDKLKEKFLNSIMDWSPAHYTQLSIGVIGKKPLASVTEQSA